MSSEARNSKVAPKKFDFMDIFSESYSLAQKRNQVTNARILALLPENDSQTTEMDPLEESSLDTESDYIGPSPEDMAAENPYYLPITQNLTLSHGCKPLTAIGVDPAGARVATGGFDFDVKLWDFGGMDNACRPFKAFRPCEEHQIKHLDFSPSGEHLLVISGSAQAFIVDRDGEAVCYTNKGYQYITDPASAKGHTHALHWGMWHPLDSNKLLTCSQDSTLRVWDINDAEAVMNETRIPTHKIVIKTRNAQGRKTSPTSCAYSKDGQLIAAGCQDGSIQIWDTRKPLVNTTQICRTAHPINTDITCINWSWDSKQLLSRGMNDDTMKLWDTRELSKGAIHVFKDLPVLFNQSEVTFSPNDQVLAVAVSVPRNDPKRGQINFYRRDNFQLINQFSPCHGSVIGLTWHHRLNQVFCSSSDGVANVYYDSKVSHNGALMCANRQATTSSRRRHTGTGEAYMKPIILTYDEEAVRIARKNKKYLNQTEIDSEVAMAAVNAILQKDHQTIQAAKEDEAKQRVPNREESVGNRVGSLHQFMVQQIVLKKNEADERAEKDIRGAILRHADEAKKQPFWTRAYLKTQPNPIFHNPDEEVKKDDTPIWKKQKLA
ncbi:unnamed protein product [Schistosoma intercalatum]|nr:unnamed protein product [Schistosoma intercalatum]CAH8520797.1 unnamed protein product [Schistosoma intercalatum]